MTALALAFIGIAEAQWSFKHQATLQEKTITGASLASQKVYSIGLFETEVLTLGSFVGSIWHGSSVFPEIH